MAENINQPEEISWDNPLKDKEEVSLEEYLETYKTKITQESEKLFVREFLFPLLGSKNIKYVIPQYPFLDSEGRNRRIDFALRYEHSKIALEVNGETYHAEGIIANDVFDDNLNRQNEIFSAGWYLLRFSYSQLQSPEWRPRVASALFRIIKRQLPILISETIIEPNYLQREALAALDYYRKKGWKKGIVVLPTGTGKTFLSAFDTTNVKGRILFLVHRLDILSQSKEAFEKVYPQEKLGLLTGEAKEYVTDSKVLFASKDTLRNPEILNQFSPTEFDYIIVDEVHHGQAPSYQIILKYFEPNVFMLGLTATPDRMDRKDIFELFDYQKVFEYSLNDAIENGYLVPYTYYGLKDNIDYNNIRFNGTKYNVADLDRHLIIKDRNEQIYNEYLEKGKGFKALGFCCSIKHAQAMAAFFNAKGVPSCAITSDSADREELTKGFRENKYNVAFTVDLFNEGVDFPDLRVLLFLRPTESKTVFFQQLGRGLRLCGGKEDVVIIDFIGNYKKANNIRKYLAKSETEQKNQGTGRVEKIVYEYTPKCKVEFEAEVEQILDRQDTAAREITKEDLIDAYYSLAEKLNKKPTQDDINREGEYKVGRYNNLFGTWVNFLKEIGEHTEFSYHFPQGTHLGHILYVLKSVGSGRIQETRFRTENVRFSGGYDAGVAGNFQRKIKYMLQAAMEMGILIDFREAALEQDFELAFTGDGQEIYTVLRPIIDAIDLSFKADEDGDYSWSMICEGTVNSTIREFLNRDINARTILRKVFLQMDAVSLLLKYLYSIQRKAVVRKSEIYGDFFEAPFVRAYLDRHGLEIPTGEVIKRRVPFLFNILDALGIINQATSEITVVSFVPAVEVIRFDPAEKDDVIIERINKLKVFAESGHNAFMDDEISQLKEAFGADFLSGNYYLPIQQI
jgi:superfamily II DNA or RNA helicase